MEIKHTFTLKVSFEVDYKSLLCFLWGVCSCSPLYLYGFSSVHAGSPDPVHTHTHTHTHTVNIIKLTAGFFFASTKPTSAIDRRNKVSGEVGVCPLIIITSAAACFQMINNETSVTNVSVVPGASPCRCRRSAARTAVRSLWGTRQSHNTWMEKQH